MSRSRASAKAAGTRDWEVIESRLAEVPALLAERDALAAKLDAVRALHQAYVCEECREDPSGGACREDPSCEACDSMSWPCPTIRALDEEADA